MKIMKMKPGFLALLSFALISSLRLQAETNVVVFDPFTGAVGTGINFTAPQDHGGIGVDFWTGPDTGLVMNGSALEATEGPRNAYLPFFPADGNKYRLSVDMQTTHTGDDWFAIGFADTAMTTEWFPAGNSTGWFLLRGVDATAQVHTFIGPQLVGGDGVGFYSGPHNLAVVLNTMAANWTFEYFIDGVSMRGPVLFSDTPDVNPNIYYVGMGSYTLARGTMDNFKLEIIEHIDLTKPTVLQQPQDATVVIGGMATFSVTASGAKPLSYQWFKNDTVELAGEVNATLTVSNLTFADNGTKYSVKISNDSGSATSSNATLTVLNVAGPLVHKFNFNEGTANDSVGGVTGTLNGSAHVQGGLLLEDGTQTGYVDLSYYPVPPSGNATVVAWFRASPSVGLRSRLFGFGSGILNYLYFSPYQGSPTTARLALKTGTDAEAFVDFSPALNDNLDHQVAAVIDSTPTGTGANGTMFLYIDGNLAGLSDLNGTAALSSLASGPKNFFGKALFIDQDSYFKGSIDEVRVYNTALSQAEIAALVPDTNPATPPEITDQPVDTTAFLGGSAKFSIAVLGSKPMSYQWRFLGTNIVGANASVYTIDDVNPANYGSYDVVATNNYGSVTSAVVQLIQTLWSYTSWSDDTTSGVDPGYLYTHAYNFGSATSTDINGVTFTGIAVVNPSVVNLFDVSGIGSVYNNDVNNITGFSQPMANDFIYGGAPGTLTLYGLTPGKDYLLTLFSVAFEGPGARTILFSAADNQQLLVDQDTYGDNNGIRISYQYTADANGSVTITNNQTVAGATFHFYGFCNRLENKLAATAPPEILNQPSLTGAALGAPASLTVNAGGPAPLSYQWHLNGVNINNANATNYDIASVQPSDFGNYTVVVKNNYGSVTSLVAQLSLLRWSYTNWTDDASTGIDTNYVYTHAYNFGKAVDASINGLVFKGIAGGNPSVSNAFSLTGVGIVYNNDANNLTGGGQTMATDFIYGGNPGTLTLKGLTPGKQYLLSLFSVGWDASGRTIRFTAADGQMAVIDQDAYDNDNGIRINYEYTADANGTLSIQTRQVGTLGNHHMYGFANRELQLPSASIRIVREASGLVTLSWPASAAGYSLKAASVLGTGALWQAVPEQPTLNGGFYQVTLPATGTQFYRLQK